MSGLARRSICLLGFLFVLGSPLRAQENLDSGKSPAALFASDCVICHKSPQGLAKGRVLELDSFLREHYTASRESAAAIAAYLQSAGNAPAPGSATKRTGKGDDKPKAAEKKPATGKSVDTKTGDTKPSEAKPSEAKPSEAKPSEAKPSEAKPSEAKPSEAKPSDAKPSESKPSEPKPDQSPKSD